VFKNIITHLQKSGHSLCIVARNKDLTLKLLKSNGLNFIDRGRGGKSFIKKLFYAIKIQFFYIKQNNNFQPDLLLSFSSPYLSNSSFFSKVPHIVLDDTDNDYITRLFYAPFSQTIITPYSFPLKYKNKQIRFLGNFELAYLHPKWFTPNPSVIEHLGLKPKESYCIVRFVDHFALHDFLQKGISNQDKINIIKKLKLLGKVFISSEIPLCDALKSYEFPLPATELHDAIAFASLVYGESNTMASEAAVLGTPAIYIDPVGRCYTREEEEKYELVYRFDSTSEGITKSVEKSIELLSINNINNIWQNRRNHLLSDSIDVTAFLIWFIENYPESFKIMNENPDYQYTFK
jgi:uncharacterized protein